MHNSTEEKIDPKTYQIIYQSYQDRNNQLSSLNHAAVGFTVAFLAAMIGAYATFFNDLGNEQILLVIVFAAVFEITLWRVYAHYIDLSIIGCYQKISNCEENLHIFEDNPLSIGKQKPGLFDRGHTIIDIFAYGGAIVILALFSIQNHKEIFSEVVLVFFILFTASWIIFLKTEKCKMQF